MREESGTVGPGSGEGYPAGIDLPQPRASLGPGLRCRADSPPALRRILSLQTRMAIAAAFIACSDPGSADFFVAPDGHDTHPGTRAEPFGTLEAVRDAIRALKRNGAFPEKGLTVWLRGGDYLRVQALELGPEDSGLPDGPVVWRGRRAPLRPSCCQCSSGNRTPLSAREPINGRQRGRHAAGGERSNH